MQIKKLTITPLDSSRTKLVDAYYPSVERAQLLMTNRIESGLANIKYNKSEKPKTKIPKFLKNFVNPKTKADKS